MAVMMMHNSCSCLCLVSPLLLVAWRRSCVSAMYVSCPHSTPPWVVAAGAGAPPWSGLTAALGWSALQAKPLAAAFPSSSQTLPTAATSSVSHLLHLWGANALPWSRFLSRAGRHSWQAHQVLLPLPLQPSTSTQHPASSSAPLSSPPPPRPVTPTCCSAALSGCGFRPASRCQQVQ